MKYVKSKAEIGNLKINYPCARIEGNLRTNIWREWLFS